MTSKDVTPTDMWTDHNGEERLRLQAEVKRLTTDRDRWKERHDRERAAHAKNLIEQQKCERERDELAQRGKGDMTEMACGHFRADRMGREDQAVGVCDMTEKQLGEGFAFFRWHGFQFPGYSGGPYCEHCLDLWRRRAWTFFQVGWNAPWSYTE